MTLEVELKTYRNSLQELLADEGKYVLIQGDEIVGLFDTYADALQSGYDKCGLDPFLVKQIESNEQIQFFTRPIEPCPT